MDDPSIGHWRIHAKRSESHLTMDNDVIKHRLMHAIPIATVSVAHFLHRWICSREIGKVTDTLNSYSNHHCPVSASRNHRKEQHNRQKLTAIRTRTTTHIMSLCLVFCYLC